MNEDQDTTRPSEPGQSVPSDGVVWGLTIFTIVVAVGGGLLAWDGITDMQAGRRLSGRSTGFVIMYPVVAIGMVGALVQVFRQRRRDRAGD